MCSVEWADVHYVTRTPCGDVALGPRVDTPVTDVYRQRGFRYRTEHADHLVNHFCLLLMGRRGEERAQPLGRDQGGHDSFALRPRAADQAGLGVCGPVLSLGLPE